MHFNVRTNVFRPLLLPSSSFFTLTEVFRAFSSFVRQMPEYNSHRRGTARTLSNWFDHSGFESQKAFQTQLSIMLFCVMICVNVYCTTATGCQPNLLIVFFCVMFCVIVYCTTATGCQCNCS